MSRFQKSKDYMLKSVGFVFLLGFISLGAVGGCSNNGGSPCGGLKKNAPAFSQKCRPLPNAGQHPRLIPGLHPTSLSALNAI